jgi:hypothetical protein
MEDAHHRRRDMALRMKDFTTNNSFPANSMGAQLATRLDTLLVELDQLVATQSSSDGLARSSTDTVEAAREAVREDLEAYARTARAIDHQVPGFAERFRLPAGNNDQVFIDTGMAFAENAAPEAVRFIAFGMPADFIEDLQNDVAALRAAISARSNSVADRKASGALIENKLDEIMLVRRELDAYVRNAHRDDPRVLSEWISAKHIQRAPKKTGGSGGSGPADGGSGPGAPKA